MAREDDSLLLRLWLGIVNMMLFAEGVFKSYWQAECDARKLDS